MKLRKDGAVRSVLKFWGIVSPIILVGFCGHNRIWPTIEAVLVMLAVTAPMIVVGIPVHMLVRRRGL